MSKINLWFCLGLIASFLITLTVFSPLLDVLRTSASGMDDGESEEIVELVPDIRQIYEEALLTPLEQAGEEITDSEIKAFYDKLLTNAGLKRE